MSPTGPCPEANSRPSFGVLSPIPGAIAQEPFKGFSQNSALERKVPSHPRPPRFQQPFSLSSAGHGQAQGAGFFLQPLLHFEALSPSPSCILLRQQLVQPFTAQGPCTDTCCVLRVCRRQATTSPSQDPASRLSTLLCLAPSLAPCVAGNTQARRHWLARSNRVAKHGG